MAGQTLDSFTSCIVGSSRTTYCLTTPTTLDHSRATHVQSVSVVAWRGRRSLGPKRAICGDEFVVQCWRSQWRTSSSPAAEDTALGVRKWPRCSIVHGFRAVRNAAQRSPCGSMGRGVGLGSRTHGLLGVDHLLARAQVVTVHSVITEPLVDTASGHVTMADAKLAGRHELAYSTVLDAGAGSPCRFRETLTSELLFALGSIVLARLQGGKKERNTARERKRKKEKAE